jgi:tricorn protease
MRRFALGLTLLAAALAPLMPASAQAPNAVKFLRYAAIANDGTIAFTYHDDIWLANNDGSNPRRLTIARAHTRRA